MTYATPVFIDDSAKLGRTNPSGQEWHDQKQAAQQRRAIILALIDSKPMRALEITAITKTTARVARSDLSTLIAQGLAHSVVDGVTRAFGTSFVSYHSGPGSDARTTLGFQERRPHRTSWKPDHPAHTPLMACLYGLVAV